MTTTAAPSSASPCATDARLWTTDDIDVDAALSFCAQRPPSGAARREIGRLHTRVTALHRPATGDFEPVPVLRESGRAARKRAADNEAAAAGGARPVKRRRPKASRRSAPPDPGVTGRDDFSDLLAAVRAAPSDESTPLRRAATGQAIDAGARRAHAGAVSSDHAHRSAVLEEAFRLLMNDGDATPSRTAPDGIGDTDSNGDDVGRLGALQEEACRVILEDFVQTLAVSDYYHGDADSAPRLDVAAARRNLVQLALQSGASIAEGDDARRKLAHELYGQFRAAVRKTAAERGLALDGDMDSCDESDSSAGSLDDDIDDLLDAGELDHGDTVALESALRARHASGSGRVGTDDLLDSDDDVDDEYAMPSMRGVGPAGMTYMQNQMRSILSVAYERVSRERGSGVEARCLGEVPIIGPQHVRRYLREPDYTCGERVCSNAGRAFNTVSGEYQHRPDENRCMAFWDFGFALREFRTPDEEVAAAAAASTAVESAAVDAATTTTTTTATDVAGPCIYCIRATVNYMFWSHKCNNAQQSDVVIQPHGYMTGVPGAYSTAWMLPQVRAFHGLSAAFIRHVRSNYFEDPDGVPARNDPSRLLRTLVEDRRVFFEQ